MSRLGLFELFVFALPLALFHTAHASPIGSPIETPPWIWRKGSFGISANTEYFSSKANYGPARGEYTRLTGDNNLTDFQTSIRGRYAFWPQFSMYGGFGFTQVRAVDSINEKSNNGVSDVFAGGHFIVWREWLRMIAEVEAGVPVTNVVRNQTVPMVTEGSMWARGLLHLRKDAFKTKFFGHFGVRVPTEGLAKTLLYGVFAEVPLGKLSLGGGVDGYETLMGDELSLAERSATAVSANAGSFRYRAFDPALLRARAWVGFRPGNTTEVRVGYDKTITGLRAAEGQALTLNVVFSSILRKPKPLPTVPTGERISAPGNTRDFKLDSERTDPEVIAPGNDFEPTGSDDLNETERLLDER